MTSVTQAGIRHHIRHAPPQNQTDNSPSLAPECEVVETLSGDTLTCMVRVPAQTAYVRKVREAVVASLSKLDQDQDMLDDAELVVSELLTNSIVHAQPLSDGTIRVRWKVRGEVVELEVTDGGAETVPTPAPANPWLSSGRGLRIVRALAHEWGATEDRAGSVVWAALGGPSRRRAV